MRIKPIAFIFLITVIFCLHETKSAFSAPANVSVNINGYLPAPPGVNVRIDSGRPYYVESDRRVYMERRPGKHYKKKHKHHENNGNGYGHEKRGKHGH